MNFLMCEVRVQYIYSSVNHKTDLYIQKNCNTLDGAITNDYAKQTVHKDNLSNFSKYIYLYLPLCIRL